MTPPQHAGGPSRRGVESWRADTSGESCTLRLRSAARREDGGVGTAVDGGVGTAVDIPNFPQQLSHIVLRPGPLDKTSPQWPALWFESLYP